MDRLVRGLTAATVAIALTLGPAAANPCTGWPVPILNPAEVGRALLMVERIRGLLNGQFLMQLNWESMLTAAGAPAWIANTAATAIRGGDWQTALQQNAFNHGMQYMQTAFNTRMQELHAENQAAGGPGLPGGPPQVNFRDFEDPDAAMDQLQRGWIQASFDEGIKAANRAGIDITIDDLYTAERMYRAVGDRNIHAIMADPALSPYMASMAPMLSIATNPSQSHEAWLNTMRTMGFDVQTGVLDEALGIQRSGATPENVLSLIRAIPTGPDGTTGVDGQTSEIEAHLRSGGSADEALANYRAIMAGHPEVALRSMLDRAGVDPQIETDIRTITDFQKMMQDPEKMTGLALILGGHSVDMAAQGRISDWFASWTAEDQANALTAEASSTAGMRRLMEAVDRGAGVSNQFACPRYASNHDYTWGTMGQSASGLDAPVRPELSADAEPTVRATDLTRRPTAQVSHDEIMAQRRLFLVERAAATFSMANATLRTEASMPERPEECETLLCETDVLLSTEDVALTAELHALQLSIMDLMLTQAEYVAGIRARHLDPE